MPHNGLVVTQGLVCIELSRELIFIIELVYAVVAEPADIDTCIELGGCVFFSESVTPVDFSGNQVVES